MKKKRVLASVISSFLILLMIFTLVMSVSAEQTEIFVEGDWEYKVINDNVIISGYTGEVEDLAIPLTLGGKTVTMIGEYAFASHKTLTSIEIPSGVTSIEAGAFQYCDSLKSVIISESVESIAKEWAFGLSCFYGCNNLENIIVDAKNEKFSSEDGVLYSKDKSVLIYYPKGKNNSKFDIPDTVKYFDRMVFEDCKKIKKVTIPNSVTAISYRAFAGCSNLEEINIPTGVASIGESAFGGCKNLKNIVIPDSVKSIEIYAFSGCSSLIEIAIPESVQCLNYVTDGTRVEGIGDKVMEEALCFSGCSNLENIIVDSNNSKFSSEDGILYNKDKSKMLCYPAGKNEGNFTIKNGVKKIRAYAFNQCEKLKTIVIPESVINIENSAIIQCKNIVTVKFMGAKPDNLDRFISTEKNINILYPRKLESSWKDYNIYPKQGYGESIIDVQEVNLNKTKLSIVKGKTYKLKQTVMPNNADDKTVIWSSSNTKIATVSQDGVIKANNKGTCVIFVITNDGKKKAECKITVIIPVKKIKLNRTKIIIEKGKTYKLKAVVTPVNSTDKKIVWSSTNKKIAKVSKGKVKARKKGICYIVVKTKDGNKKARCKVIVK